MYIIKIRTAQPSVYKLVSIRAADASVTAASINGLPTVSRYSLIQGVSGERVNILEGGSMDYSE
jgi:hypothetical protein